MQHPHGYAPTESRYIFGYVTATLASFFIGRDANSDQAEVAGARATKSLRAEIRARREDIAEITRHQ